MAVSIACIAVNEGKILIAHRIPSGQMGGRWEFPGGKVEEGEDILSAIKREMQEEFSVDVEPVEKITSSTFIHNEKTVSLEVYYVKFPHCGKAPYPEYKLTEHTGYAWVAPEEIRGLRFVDSDLKICSEVFCYVKENCN